MDPLCFTVGVDVLIRECREEDLPALEWFGLFAAERPLIRRVFEQHRRGDALMLVAQANGHASGQLWVDLAHEAEGHGEIWAVRVLPCLQGRGLGTRLMAHAEALLAARSCARALVTVERSNVGALRLYQRLGYAPCGTRLAGSIAGTLPEQDRHQWLLAKTLHPPPPAGASACAGPSAT
jgi:ribosomal protein S18 acetylase RimI-like enzyme